MISSVKEQEVRSLEAAGRVEAFGLIPIQEGRHVFGVPGFLDIVDIVVYAKSEEEALQMAREAIASLTADRSTNAA